MQWFRSHPFALLFAGAGMCLLFIIIGIRGTSTPATAPGHVVAITPIGGFENPRISSVSGSSNEAPTSVEPAALPVIPSSGNTGAQPPTPVYIHAPIVTESTPSTGASQPPTLDLPPVQQPQSHDTSTGDALIKEVYSFIPTSISPLNGPTAPSSRTPAQQALYLYGNEAGLAVLSFENAHADMADVLKAWITDRKNEGGKAAVTEIAQAMIATGDTVAGLPGVPASAQSVNQQLAAGYRNAGKKLTAVVNAGSDGSLVDAMKTYNTTADDFTKSYVAIVNLLSGSGVTFSSTDPGSAFSFQGSATSL